MQLGESYIGVIALEFSIKLAVGQLRLKLHKVLIVMQPYIRRSSWEKKAKLSEESLT